MNVRVNRFEITDRHYVAPPQHPQRIARLEFGPLSAEEARRLAEVEVFNHELYLVPARRPVNFGPLDPRMGISEKKMKCDTCDLPLSDCPGHFGVYDLVLPLFHPGFLRSIIECLQCVCKSCSRVLLPLDQRERYLLRFRNPRLNLGQRRSLYREVVAWCKKQTICSFCGEYNGPVKKVAPFKIIHERYGDRNTESRTAYLDEFDYAIQHNDEIKSLLSRIEDDLNPVRVLEILQRMRDEDIELLDCIPDRGRPEDFIIQNIPVPPVCIRPSVDSGAQGRTEDDLTMKIAEIIWNNSLIKMHIEKGDPLPRILEQWELLQSVYATYLNSDSSSMLGQKPIRGIAQRLKGKQGRFRGNLSGKRVDFSGRTVISPDPNLHIHEVGVPVLVAQNLTYPERVSSVNLERLRSAVRNGPLVHPGANYVIQGGDQRQKKFLRYADREQAAQYLSIGDIVERHMIDGDVVLFNRQPSLHRMSIMCHRARILPYRTFRFNECVCSPYNADFDGDEMNLHLPQTEEARAEAATLMGVLENLITPKNGSILISATQDFITAAYLVTRQDVFFDKADFCQCIAMMGLGDERIDLPPPTILKPMQLWTGKQLLRVLLCPRLSMGISVNLEVKGRIYDRNKFFDPNHSYICIQDSELLTGIIDKSVLGDSKKGIFFALARDYTPSYSALCMARLARFAGRWLANRGFSIGIGDVTPSDRLLEAKSSLLQEGYKECDRQIELYKLNKLPLQSGCNAEQSLESILNGLLSEIRGSAGKICVRELHHHNAPLIMAICGSKGSNINISQMIACVGQQTVNGGRIPNGFVHRSLPHFLKHSKEPAAKGFVPHSFYDGLTPTQFFFHTMAGREGLVDTAVKTADTGYMQRKLVKSLEDLYVHYDNTVRTATTSVVQFKYGNDCLDPQLMEGDAIPVNFDRTLYHAKHIPAPTVFVNETPSSFSTREFVHSWKNAQHNLLEDSSLDRFGCRRPTKLYPFEISAMYQLWKDILLRDPVFPDSFFLGMDSHISSFVESTAKARESLGLVGARTSVEIIGKHTSLLFSSVSDKTLSLTQEQLEAYFALCELKTRRSLVHPGQAVGAIAAQSIGEPATQMTLKTFHFAGVASMNITLGVPRMNEIINASKSIKTPIITASLENPHNEDAARIVKGRLECTTLGEVSEYIREVYTSTSAYVSVKLDLDLIESLQLRITPRSVSQSIVAAPKLKIREKNIVLSGTDRVDVYPPDTSREKMYYVLQALKNALPHVLVEGIPSIARAVISHKDSTSSKAEYQLLVEGTNLQKVMTTPGVVGTRTKTNSIMETRDVLGIEAARQTIINEIQYTMSNHGMDIDSRHITLLAECMTMQGEVYGVNRSGIAHMKESVLMLASFEKTIDHLYEAAAHCRTDSMQGVSESIITGAPIAIGTGLFKLLHKHKPIHSIRKRVPMISGIASSLRSVISTTHPQSELHS